MISYQTKPKIKSKTKKSNAKRERKREAGKEGGSDKKEDIGVSGGKALAQAVGGHKGLRQLDLSALQGSSRNHLGPKGAFFVAQALSSNSSLSFLSPSFFLLYICSF